MTKFHVWREVMMIKMVYQIKRRTFWLIYGIDTRCEQVEWLEIYICYSLQHRQGSLTYVPPKMLPWSFTSVIILRDHKCHVPVLSESWNRGFTMNHIAKFINFICGLQLPREPHRSTRLLQLTGRWQHDGIMWLALRSVKSNNVDFLNQIRYLSIK